MCPKEIINQTYAMELFVSATKSCFSKKIKNWKLNLMFS